MPINRSRTFDPVLFGQFLEILRRENLKLNAKALAGKIKVAPLTLLHYESGSTTPTLATVAAIAEAADITLRQLVISYDEWLKARKD